MNSSTLDKESDCSLAKHFLNFKEIVGVVFLGFTLENKADFGFSSSIGEALTHLKSHMWECIVYTYIYCITNFLQKKG